MLTGGSGLARVQRAALAAAVPLAVHLELTHDCNLECGICCNPRLSTPQHSNGSPRHSTGTPGHSAGRLLDVATWSRVLDDLRDLGTLTITLTGGEPLLHPDFLAIARAARSGRFALRILSNGTLINDDMAVAIAELLPLAVEISIHGAEATTHDRTTGITGSYYAAWQGIDRLCERDVRVVVTTPVTRLNATEIETIVEHTQRRDLPVRFDSGITPRDDGCPGPLAFTAGSGVIQEVMARVGEPPAKLDRQPGESNCGVGRLTLAIDPLGEVYPCIQWRSSSLGNVRAASLGEIWRSSPERRRVAEVARAANDSLLELGGAGAAHPYCPAVAARTTGDPLRPDAAFLTQAEIAHSLREGV